MIESAQTDNLLPDFRGDQNRIEGSRLELASIREPEVQSSEIQEVFDPSKSFKEELKVASPETFELMLKERAKNYVPENPPFDDIGYDVEPRSMIQR